jgi:hypothetical protein
MGSEGTRYGIGEELLFENPRHPTFIIKSIHNCGLNSRSKDDASDAQFGLFGW